MQLINTLKGSGWINGAPAQRSQTQYTIGVWRAADGAVFGHGEISGDADTIVGLPWRPVSLLLADGQALDVTVVGPGTAAHSAEIYVQSAAASGQQVAAAWPG